MHWRFAGGMAGCDVGCSASSPGGSRVSPDRFSTAERWRELDWLGLARRRPDGDCGGEDDGERDSNRSRCAFSRTMTPKSAVMAGINSARPADAMISSSRSRSANHKPAQDEEGSPFGCLSSSKLCKVVNSCSLRSDLNSAFKPPWVAMATFNNSINSTNNYGIEVTRGLKRGT